MLDEDNTQCASSNFLSNLALKSSILYFIDKKMYVSLESLELEKLHCIFPSYKCHSLILALMEFKCTRAYPQFYASKTTGPIWDNSIDIRHLDNFLEEWKIMSLSNYYPYFWRICPNVLSSSQIGHIYTSLKS